MTHEQRVAHLMPLRRERPFLREAKTPRGHRQRTLPRADVLHHAALLIVRFFDQEAVVFDARCLRRERCGDRAHHKRDDDPHRDFSLEVVHAAMRPGGFEPPTNSLEGCCSIHLSYGRLLLRIADCELRILGVWIKESHVPKSAIRESERRDSNPRPPGPKPGALPDCATPRNARQRQNKT